MSNKRRVRRHTNDSLRTARAMLAQLKKVRATNPEYNPEQFSRALGELTGTLLKLNASAKLLSELHDLKNGMDKTDAS